MKKINPNYQSLYNYCIDQKEDQVFVIFKVPEGFDTNSISIQCNNTDLQKYALTVGITNELPFICGTLYSEVFPESIKNSVESRKIKDKTETYFNITFQKKSKTIWPILISDKHPILDEIDPMSSYILYTVQSKSTNGFDKVHAQENIEYAQRCGLPLATRVYAQILYDNGEKEKSINLLRSSFKKYNDLDVLCQLGRSLYFWKKETRKEGLNLLKRASKHGKKEVNGLIGQILSPFSDLEYKNKDPKAALYYLRLALGQSNEEDDEDFENVEIDIEVVEEEEEKNDEKVPNDADDAQDEEEKLRAIYMKEVEKILDSGIIEIEEKRREKKFVTIFSTLAALGVVLLYKAKQQRNIPQIIPKKINNNLIGNVNLGIVNRYLK